MQNDIFEKKKQCKVIKIIIIINPLWMWNKKMGPLFIYMSQENEGKKEQRYIYQGKLVLL